MTTTTNTNATPLALVPHSEGEQSVAQFLEGLPEELTRIFTLVDERQTYKQEEFSRLRTIQSQRFENLLGKMTKFHHACTSTLGIMLHQAELLKLHEHAPGGPFKLWEWATRHHIGMPRTVFEQAYELGKALPILTELGVPQEYIDSPQLTKDKAIRILNETRDLVRQKKPIFERLADGRLKATGQEVLSPEEETALEEQAYQEVIIQARVNAINLINRTDEDLRREQDRASGLKDRVPFIITGVTYRRLTDAQIKNLERSEQDLPSYDEGLGVLTGQMRIYISDQQVEDLEKSGRYFLSLRWGHEEDLLNAQKLGSKIAEQIADELDAIDSLS